MDFLLGNKTTSSKPLPALAEAGRCGNVRAACRLLLWSSRRWAVAMAMAVAMAGGCGSAPRPTPRLPTLTVSPIANFSPPSSFGPEVDKLVRRALLAKWAPAFAVVTLAAGRLEFHNYSFAGAAPTADTVFEIGSLTKLFTAVLAAQEVILGRRSLHDTLADFRNGCAVPSRDGRPVRLWHFATHRTGLPRLPPDWAPANPLNPYADYTPARLRRSLAVVKPKARPGQDYAYSNYAFGLLGDVIATAAGESYEQVVRERVLAPLSMADTAFVLTDSMRERVIQGYGRQGEPVPNWDIPGLAGAGALRSTARDMAKFLWANVHPPSTALGDAIRLTHAHRASAGDGFIGLGWKIGLPRYSTLSEVRWHNGETGGYHTFLAFDPRRDIGVLVMANRRHGIDGLGIGILLALRGEQAHRAR